MKKYLLTFIVLLSGCATPVPVTVTFPVVPEQLTVVCPQLKQISEGASLSDIAKVVADNYKMYHECSENNSGLIDWLTAQKKIFGKIK